MNITIDTLNKLIKRNNDLIYHYDTLIGATLDAIENETMNEDEILQLGADYVNYVKFKNECKKRIERYNKLLQQFT